MKSPLKLQNQFFLFKITQYSPSNGPGLTVFSLPIISLILSLTTLLFFVTLLHFFLLPTSYVLLLLCLKRFFSRFFPIGLVLQFQSLLKVRPSVTLLFNSSHSPSPKFQYPFHTFLFSPDVFCHQNMQYSSTWNRQTPVPSGAHTSMGRRGTTTPNIYLFVLFIVAPILPIKI